MKCPFCAETIQPTAKKCRFCGEWLDKSITPASSDARAVAKGIKKQKQDEAESGCLGCVSILVGVGFAVAIGGDFGGWVGIVLAIAGLIWAGVRYNRE